MRANLRLLLALLVVAAATLVLVPWNWLAAQFHLPGLRWTAWAWNRTTLFAMGWRVRIEGELLPRRPLLLAANHVSWSDVVILAAFTDAAFIAKSEVAGWPLFGLLARLHDTIFIDREHKRTTATQTRAVARRLEEGKALVLFPEGTTADGNHLDPFKSSLFGAVGLAAADAGHAVAVQPVAIAYTRLYGVPMGRSERAVAAWVGDAGLVEHIRELFRHGPLDVTLRFGTPLDVAADRKRLAREAQAQVRAMTTGILRG